MNGVKEVPGKGDGLKTSRNGWQLIRVWWRRKTETREEKTVAKSLMWFLSQSLTMYERRKIVLLD